MSAEFVDTNILVYAHSGAAGTRHTAAVELIARLAEDGVGALSTQVLMEFYSAVTRKLSMKSEDAEMSIRDFAHWIIHRPTHANVLDAVRMQRRYKLSWWDAMIVMSAIETGAQVLWSEDLTHEQRFGDLVVRNPFL
jgi:predicted nucleic acid-binding protein